MNKDEFIRIAEKVGEGTASAEEIAKYNSYFNQAQREQPIWDTIDFPEKEAIGQLIDQRIYERLHQGRGTKRRPIIVWSPYATAAAILLFLSIGIYSYKNSLSTPHTIVQNHTQDLKPGGSRAFLTLTNGQKIDLDNAKNTNLLAQTGITVLKTKAGELVYKVDQSFKAQGSHLLETPKGGQYHIQLSDGTHVWLNSASSISYPLKFTEEQRIVEVRGEAYFEVAHDAEHPFIVKSNRQQVKVLGTHFNVMAYDDEPMHQTTLINGSVEVSTAQNKLILKPGQQAQVNDKGASYNSNADIDGAIAWKSGKILFVDQDIKDIMKILSRWYNFDVEYQGKIANTTFGGSFSRHKNLSVILKSLESTGDIHFKIEGRRVIVMP